MIVGHFNTSLTMLDRSSKQKINKETIARDDIKEWTLGKVKQQ